MCKKGTWNPVREKFPSLSPASKNVRWSGSGLTWKENSEVVLKSSSNSLLKSEKSENAGACEEVSGVNSRRFSGEE